MAADGFDRLLDTNPERWPEVTVCVSLYRYPDFVEQALGSLLTQTLRDFALVVVDDHSMDRSLEQAGAWIGQNQQRFTRAVLLHNHRNGGLSECRNRGIDYTTSPFVFVLDADNLLYPRCLQRCLETLSATDAAFAYPLIEQFDGARELVNVAGWDPDRLRSGNYIDAMVLMRRSAWQERGGYSDMHGLGWEDYDLWCRMARAGAWGVQVPEILARYRVHGGSMLRTVTDRADSLERLWALFRERYPGWVRG